MMHHASQRSVAWQIIASGIVFAAAMLLSATTAGSAESIHLPDEPIEKEIEATIRSRMPWKNEDVTIGDIRFDKTVALPAGRLSYRVVPNRGEDFLGRTLLALHLFVDGKPVRRLWAHATISVMADVVTVIRPLGRHQRIERADLALQRRDLAALSPDAVGRIADALGNRTTRMIYPHTVLESSMMVSPPLVSRGDVVKIVAKSGPMIITAAGTVKEPGGKGDRVRVVNMDSNRAITARVTGPGTVQVDF